MVLGLISLEVDINDLDRTKKSNELPKKAIDDSKKKSVFSLFNLDVDEDDDEDWIAFRERQKIREFMRQNRGKYFCFAFVNNHF